jgi:DNA-binding protein HU-beta
MAISKQEFVERVASEADLTRKEAENAVNAVLKTIESGLKSGEEITFTGFGKFHVAERGAREGRNPRTGETMQIAATKVPRFTAGSGLKKAIK